MKNIDRNANTPIYRQLQLILQDKIILGDWMAGMLLPTEEELCNQYNISRITARKALENLSNKGLIERKRGKGSIVIKNDLDGEKEHIGFSKTLLEQGVDITSKIISKNIILDNTVVSRLLDLQDEIPNKLYKFTRLRLLEGEPVAITRTYVREAIGEKMLAFDLSKESFYDIYKEITERSVIDNDGVIRAIKINEHDSKLLDIEIGSANLLYRGVAFLQGNIPIEVNYTIYHGEKLSFARPNNYFLREESN